MIFSFQSGNCLAPCQFSGVYLIQQLSFHPGCLGHRRGEKLNMLCMIVANQNFVINVSNNLGRPVFCDDNGYGAIEKSRTLRRCEVLSCSNESAVLVKEFLVPVPKRCSETIRLPMFYS